MKIRFLLLLTLLLTFTVVPVFAHEGHEGHGEHPSGASFHEKFDQFLKSVPDNASYVVSLESKTANDLLIDLRTTESFEKSPLKDALHIPLTNLHDHLKELPKDKKVFVLGESTVDGAYALVILRLHGVDAWLVKSVESSSGCPLQESQKQHHTSK